MAATSMEIGRLLAIVPPSGEVEWSGLASSRNLSPGIPLPARRFRPLTCQCRPRVLAVRSVKTSEWIETVGLESSTNGPALTQGTQSEVSSPRRKTKIVCTIGPSTSSREMIWKLAEAGMNVAWLNMSHGDHNSHQKTIDLVTEYNAQFTDNVIAIMLDTKGPVVRSVDVPQPILLKEGEEYNFTIKRGVCTEDTVSVNYDDFVNDVDAGDILLVDGGMMSLAVI